MAGSVKLIPSGFEFVDDVWGGIYRGGSYMLIGARKSGRTLMGLQFALEAAKQKEVCLYFTNMRPKDLMIQAASLNFDIQSYMNHNLIIVVRVAPPNDAYEVPNPDNYLVDYLRDIITVVEQYNPSRIIFDELTPYIGFRNLELLKDTFLNTLETIEERDVTSFFIIGEPATEKAQQIVNVITQYVTGVFQLKKSQAKINNRFHGGNIIITPNVGHTEGQFNFNYQIEPFKGVTTVPNVDDIPSKYAEFKNSQAAQQKTTPHYVYTQAKQESKEREIFNNVYSYNDFLLILNNQIALYKSTGQTFNLISIKLNAMAQTQGLISLNQLQNSVQLSTERKDKICMKDNVLMLLLVRSNPNSVVHFLNRLKNNLPSEDMDYVDTVLDNISILNTEVNQDVENAEEMTEDALNQAHQNTGSYLPINKFI